MRKIKICDIVSGNHRAGFRRGCGGMIVVGYMDNSSVWVEATPLSGRAYMYDYELDIEVPVNWIGEIGCRNCESFAIKTVTPTVL